MEPRNFASRKRSTSIKLTTGSILLAALTFTSACVVTDDQQPEENGSTDPPTTMEPSPEDNEGEGEDSIIASSDTSSAEIGGNFQIDIYALEDIGDELLRLRFGVTNKSDSSYNIYSSLSSERSESTADAVTLLDSENQNRHLVFKQEDGSCFCSELEEPIDSGDTEGMWVIFPAPEDGVDSMAVTTPLTPPIFDIPITESSETVESSGLTEGDILPLTNITDDLEDQTGRTESDDEVSILLSSDVLFDTDSADLTSEAQEILEQVATEIDDVSAEIVSVEGHADDTGTDDINEPLSLGRAEAVESDLEELITRSGVSFEVEGHGSANPIATNDTEEGRERNRRVSVTFEK